MIGPHKRQGKRRRRGKALILIFLLAAMAISSSWTAPREPPVHSRWDNPSDGLLAFARMRYRINGDNGDAHWYLTLWPEKESFIKGEVDMSEP